MAVEGTAKMLATAPNWQHTPAPAPGATGPLRPLRSVWGAPGRTVERIAHENPAYGLHALPLLAGLSFAPHPVGLLATLLISEGATIPAGPVVNLLGLHIGAYLMSAIADGFGGKATPSATRVAIAWSCVPLAALVPVNVIALIVSPWLPDRPSPVAAIAIAAFALAHLVMNAWALVIFVRSLAAINRFSLRRAGVAAVIGGVLYVATMMLMAVAPANGKMAVTVG